MNASSFGKVGVFCGGKSRERDISLQTGKAVFSSLLNSGVDVEYVDVASGTYEVRDFDIAFIALHGRDGEDGKFQAMLEYNDVPYTGSGVASSCVSMNKWYTKAIWESLGINTPAYKISMKGLDFDVAGVDCPVFVKPVNEGSSFGITYVEDKADIDAAIKTAEAFDDVVLLEQAVAGKEYTFSYLQNHDDLPLIQLETRTPYYDYDAKYVRDDTKYIVDPELDEKLQASYKAEALRSFMSLGMSGWGRIDFIVDANDKAWFIEANSVPGMTSHSLVPMAARHKGIGFDSLCIKILETAIHD